MASTPAVQVSASAVGTSASSVKSQRRKAAISSTSTISEPTETPLANSGVKRSAISRFTAGRPDRRAVPPAAATRPPDAVDRGRRRRVEIGHHASTLPSRCTIERSSRSPRPCATKPS